MSAMIIGFLIVLLSFNIFMISYQVSGINRLVLGTPMSLFETAIIMYNIDEEKGPCFDKELLVENITYYFDYHMKRYTADYDLVFYYYNPIDHSLNLSQDVQAVEVTINASLMLDYQYHKTMFYEIRSQ